jgi:hypothetical protein
MTPRRCRVASDARLERLARALALPTSGDLEAPRALRIEAYTTEFARSDLRPGAVLLRALEVPLAEP